MKVRSGETKIAGYDRVIEVELDDTDMADVEGWSELSFQQRFDRMSKRADALIVTYLLKDEIISREFAANRLRAIAQR